MVVDEPRRRRIKEHQHQQQQERKRRTLIGTSLVLCDGTVGGPANTTSTILQWECVWPFGARTQPNANRHFFFHTKHTTVQTVLSDTQTHTTHNTSHTLCSVHSPVIRWLISLEFSPEYFSFLLVGFTTTANIGNFQISSFLHSPHIFPFYPGATSNYPVQNSVVRKFQACSTVCVEKQNI